MGLRSDQHPELWSVIRTDSSLHNFKDVYDALLLANVGQGDADGDGMSDLDEVFVAHGFFADANGNYRYDPGKKSGGGSISRKGESAEHA